MADNWKVVDLTFLDGELRFQKSNRRLCVIEDKTGEITEIALSDVNIVFIGINVRLSSAVMFHFAQTDTVVLFCDWKGLPASGVYPWIDAHGRVAARQRAQASLSAPRTKNAWMRIVKAKIKGQANNLAFLERPNAERLETMSFQVKSGDPDNKEAQAARLYWGALFEKESFSRKPGERDGGRNTLLDYGYTILRGHSMRAVLSAGLTPALGLCHKGRGNAFALADDLIEPFRPALDLAIAQMDLDTHIESKETRHALLSATMGQFCLDGRTIPTVMTDFAQSFGRYVEGDVEFLDVPVWQPEKLTKKG